MNFSCGITYFKITWKSTRRPSLFCLIVPITNQNFIWLNVFCDFDTWTMGVELRNLEILKVMNEQNSHSHSTSSFTINFILFQ